MRTVELAATVPPTRVASALRASATSRWFVPSRRPPLDQGNTLGELHSGKNVIVKSYLITFIKQCALDTARGNAIYLDLLYISNM